MDELCCLVKHRGVSRSRGTTKAARWIKAVGLHAVAGRRNNTVTAAQGSHFNTSHSPSVLAT
jgi:hypothetical protein